MLFPLLEYSSSLESVLCLGAFFTLSTGLNAPFGLLFNYPISLMNIVHYLLPDCMMSPKGMSAISVFFTFLLQFLKD